MTDERTASVPIPRVLPPLALRNRTKTKEQRKLRQPDVSRMDIPAFPDKKKKNEEIRGHPTTHNGNEVEWKKIDTQLLLRSHRPRAIRPKNVFAQTTNSGNNGPEGANMDVGRRTRNVHRTDAKKPRKNIASSTQPDAGDSVRVRCLLATLSCPMTRETGRKEARKSSCVLSHLPTFSASLSLFVCNVYGLSDVLKTGRRNPYELVPKPPSATGSWPVR